MKAKQPLVKFASGATSTKIPRYDLIPREALVRISARFELGKINHRENAWNARQNPQALDDNEFLIARAAHAIDHAYKFIEKLEGIRPDDGDDDASAIAWAGVCLCAATARKKAKK